MVRCLRRSRWWAGAALALLASVAAGPARATVMLPLTLEDMAVQASVVVRGRVLDARSAWDDRHERIYTYTTLEVLEAIHSPAALPPRITVRTLGGEVDQIGMRVSGTERFGVNEEVVVFLRRDPGDAQSFQVIGMSQGKFRIEREAKGRVVAVASLEGLAFARPDPTGTLKVSPEEPRTDRIALSELRQRVLAAIDARRTPPAPTPGLTPPTQPGPTQPGPTQPAATPR